LNLKSRIVLVRSGFLYASPFSDLIRYRLGGFFLLPIEARRDSPNSLPRFPRKRATVLDLLVPPLPLLATALAP